LRDFPGFHKEEAEQQSAVCPMNPCRNVFRRSFFVETAETGISFEL
jgi:hypothetical protein